MSALLCLNDLSCNSHASKEQIDSAMRELVHLLRDVRSIRAQAALITPFKLPYIRLSSTYEMAQWIADSRNREYWQIIRRMQDRAPYSYEEVAPSEVLSGVEYTFSGTIAAGFGIAHLIDALAVSLRVDNSWETAKIALVRTSLSEADTDVISEDLVDIRHASNKSHIETHREWLANSGLDLLTRGQEIWDAREDLFPNLSFLPRVEGDLRNLTPIWVKGARDLLSEIELAVSVWDPAKQPFPEWKKVTPEGQNRKGLCTFEDLDGERRAFDLHGRFAPEPGRIHLRLIREDRSARIGYIGRKLGT